MFWFGQITRLEYVHSRHFVHRDIKPSNILIGIGRRCDEISLVDFGLAKQYRNRNTHIHIPCRTNYALTGTAAFALINNHNGLEQSRRDDLKSLAYILIYFLRGSLPWYGGANNTKTARIKSAWISKVNLDANRICASLPKEFATFLNYARALQYDETPDYKYLRRLFSDLLGCEGHKHDNAFDWHTIETSPNSVVADIETKGTQRVTQRDSTPRRM